MSEEKLKIGDVVTLNSGGPRMTIRAIDSNDMAEVSYYANNKMVNDTFPINTLKLSTGSVHARILGE